MNATSPLAAFHAALLADPAAAQLLAEPIETPRFARMAMDWANARGIALTPAMLDDTPRPAPLLLDSCPPAGWLPAKLGPDLTIDWLHFAGVAPNRSFFDISLTEAAARPLNRVLRVRTTLDTLIDAPRDPGFAPSGFVFHMSRCGSTLVAQMLGAVPGHFALSEPQLLDGLIRAPFDDPELQVEALRALVYAWSRGADRLFVKLDSWHTRALPLLRRAFPQVPWIFLHRDPVEVLVSHRRERGFQTVPGLIPLDWFGLEPDDATLPEAEYIARVLERICEPAIAQAADGGLLLDYTELPQAFFTRILPHFGLTPTPDERATMDAAARRNSKEPDTGFQPDGEAKQREARPDQHAAAARVRAALSLSSASPR
ncbi:aspartyl beta-hydroxylase [Sphingomonas sp. R-74633]|uniref:sulfotransferase family protein n=1 Tax=Sphingomonas sp. R-74633 TaxID=2751188 RepID=UPI0015D345C7|nr:sulfotransferase [Sphingomonas sp. R-74633]NYT41169.1 aspartyl beta-hydroxylase [Sphingomonas sp. R-74633]